MLLMRSRSPVSFHAIREQFPSYQTANAEAGLRAFERDKADLLDLGVPIRYVTPEEDEVVEDGGYVVELKRYRLPEIRLTPDEVSALVLAASVTAAVPGGSTPKIVDLTLKKLAFDLPELPDTPVELPPQVEAVTRRESVLLHFPDNQARELRDRFAQLESATRNRKRVTLQYKNASTGVEQVRDVDPYGLIYRHGSWLLVGYCHLRKDVRTFRVDRISSHKLAPRPKSPDFERPADFDVRAFINRSPWTFRTTPAEEVELEFGPTALDMAHEDFGVGAQRSTLADGSIRIRFSCTNPEYAVSQVLTAQGGIRVKRGKKLARQLALELKTVAERYGL